MGLENGLMVKHEGQSLDLPIFMTLFEKRQTIIINPTVAKQRTLFSNDQVESEKPSQ